LKPEYLPDKRQQSEAAGFWLGKGHSSRQVTNLG
jgi:hypothetical protein